MNDKRLFAFLPWQPILLLMATLMILVTLLMNQTVFASRDSKPVEQDGSASYMIYLPLIVNGSGGEVGTATPTIPTPTGTLPTSTPTPTGTLPTSTPTPTGTLPTSTPTPTGTLPTSTPTPTGTLRTATATSTPTPTGTLPTSTPTPTGTLPTATATSTPTPTGTLPTATATSTPTPTGTLPTSTPTPTGTLPTATATSTPTPTGTLPSSTPTPTGTLPTPTPTGTLPTPTQTLTPSPTATPHFTQAVIDDGIIDPQGVTVADIDQDNDQDVIVAFGDEDFDESGDPNFVGTDSVYLYLNGGNSNGNGGGGNWLTIPLTDTGTIMAMQTTVADFDDDNDLDVAAVTLFDKESCPHPAFTCSPGQVIWFENPGDVTDSWHTNVISDTVWGARYIDAADFTGDGLPDVVVSSIAIPDDSHILQPDGVYWFRNENNGSNWSTGIQIDMELEHVETALAVDINGDMISDIVAIGRDSDELVWYENTGQNDNPTFTKNIIATPNNPDHVTLANLDSDDLIEVVVTTNPPGSTFGKTLWYDSPFTEHSSARTTEGQWAEHLILDDPFSSIPHKVIYGADFDLDNDVDFAIVTGGGSLPFGWYRNNGDNNWTWNWLPNTGLIPYYYVTGGDINGDQRPDIVTVINDYINPETGQSAENVSWWSYGP